MISRRAIARANLAQAAPKPRFIAFAGGCDFETPPLNVPSGFCRAAENYEIDVTGGYKRLTGYERFNGKTSPSAATASVIDITLTGAIAVGDTVTGVVTGTTAVVIAVVTGYIVVTKIVGLGFDGTEHLNVAAADQATSTSLAHGASTALLRAQYKTLAADSYRADIAVPTGSGSSIGGIRISGVLYTWRNNAGGTAADIWKSTSTGWSQVTLFNEISFTVGAIAVPAEGATLTQGAVTATLKRLVLTSGTFSGGAAAGRFIITTPSGGTGNFVAGAATLTGGVTCTLTAQQTPIVLQPSGRYQFIVENFAGGSSTQRAYGCDGANRGFEFDGTVLVPISTGMTVDTPNHVYAHNNHLFFSFGSSVQHSGPGIPYVWSVILGAGEIGMGDTVTGFQTLPGSESTGALAIFTRNRTDILYGTGVSNWQKITYRAELGAYAYSIQDVGYTMFMDDQGVTSFKTAQAFGNFSHASLSERIKSWVNGKRSNITDSCVSRTKSQYRIFFSDGYVLYVTFGANKILGMMPVKLAHAATWVYSSEESDGSETIFFGSTDGMVYQMEKGTSFDGDAIAHKFHLSWDWLKSAQLIKRFHSASLEVAGTGYSEFSFTFRLGYGLTDIAQPETQNEVTSFSPTVWDQFQWDDFVWDGASLFPSLVDLGGESENISLMISGSSDYCEPIKFSGAMIRYSNRRYLR